jgi:hypothetical protein
MTPKAALAKTRRLKRAYDRAHAEGMSNLHAGDFGGLGRAIEKERLIIRAQAALINQQMKRSDAAIEAAEARVSGKAAARRRRRKPRS